VCWLVCMCRQLLLLLSSSSSYSRLRSRVIQPGACDHAGKLDWRGVNNLNIAVSDEL
jgi:hypothetical protein